MRSLKDQHILRTRMQPFRMFQTKLKWIRKVFVEFFLKITKADVKFKIWNNSKKENDILQRIIWNDPLHVKNVVVIVSRWLFDHFMESCPLYANQINR